MARNSQRPRWRVLQIVASSRGGGAEVLRCLVKGLDADEFELHVIMPDDGGHVGEADFTELGVHLHRFKLDASFNLAEFWRLRRLVRGGQFDLVHVHGARAALWGRLAAFGPRRPRLVFGVHGLSIVHYIGLKRALLVGLERSLQSITDVTICDSNVERADVLKWQIAATDRTRVIWNGIDLDRLLKPHRDRAQARQALGLAETTPTLVTVCRLNKPRDFDTLLAGMAQIVQQRAAAQLLIVGDGPLRAHVEALIAQHRLTDHVRLLGLVRDVGEVLAAADIALLITAGWEGLPLSALEAMALGRPLVISDVGGNREAVLDGETGYVIPPQDRAAFVTAVLKLLNDPDQARCLGEAGAARMQQEFGLQRMADQVAKVYRELLRRSA
jgi:glycosyltransferase involved in cell wall biosynthesis